MNDLMKGFICISEHVAGVLGENLTVDFDVDDLKVHIGKYSFRIQDTVSVHDYQAEINRLLTLINF